MQGTGPRIHQDFQTALRRVIFDRDLPCPRCGYSLSGVVGIRCPECGHNVAEFLRVVDTSPRRVRRELAKRRILRWARAGAGLALLAGLIALAMTIV